jgi:hypothetical protein
MDSSKHSTYQTRSERTLTRALVAVDLAGGAILLFLILSCASFQFGPSLPVWGRRTVASSHSTGSISEGHPNGGASRGRMHTMHNPSPRLKRCAAWYNFCIGWLLYSVSFALLTLAGEQDSFQPSLELCRAQAIMVCASVALWVFSASTVFVGSLTHSHSMYDPVR